MTVGALYKRLTALVAAGAARKPVVVDKPSFTHPLEGDGVTMIALADVCGPEWIPLADDDGGTKVNADGGEHGRVVVILSGGAR